MKKEENKTYRCPLDHRDPGLNPQNRTARQVEFRSLPSGVSALQHKARGCSWGRRGLIFTLRPFFSSFLGVLEQALWAKAQEILPGCDQGVNFFLGKGLPLLMPMESVRDSGAVIRGLKKENVSGGEASQSLCYRGLKNLHLPLTVHEILI